MIYKILLALHILSGFLALFCGTSSVITAKGGLMHRLFGKVFYYSLLSVCFTAIYISIITENRFLLHIAVFSFYLNYFGFKAVADKSLKPSVFDWMILLLTLMNVFYILMSRNIILIVFGSLCFYLAIQQIRINIKINRNKALEANAWLKRHIGMMMGAFISTATAFLVVNSQTILFKNVPGWIIWLFPTFIFLPLSIYFSRKYTKG